MKKSILAIMLIALALTLGLMVSCQPDDPAIYGTYEYDTEEEVEESPGIWVTYYYEYRLVVQDPSTFSLSIAAGPAGSIVSLGTFNGTYSASSDTTGTMSVDLSSIGYGTMSGSYSLNGDTLRLNDHGAYLDFKRK